MYNVSSGYSDKPVVSLLILKQMADNSYRNVNGGRFMHSVLACEYISVMHKAGNTHTRDNTARHLQACVTPNLYATNS